MLSGGRFRLGLGVSGPQVSEGWYGVPFRRPLRRTREYVEIVRKVLAREAPLEHAGEEWTLPLPDGLGKPLKLLARPVQERIPIYLGAIGPKAIEQVGEIADGWLPFLLNPREPERAAGPVARRARSGRGARSTTSTSPPSCRCRSTRTSRRRATSRGPGWRSTSARWAPRTRTSTSTSPPSYGHGDSAREVQERIAGGRPDGRRGRGDARADRRRRASPPRPAGLDDKLAAYEAAGVTTLVAVPGGDRAATVRLLAEAARERVA